MWIARPPPDFLRPCVREYASYILVPYTLTEGPAVSTSTVFTNNRSQAVRLPADLRLPEGVKRVTVHARGQERIISPINNSWDSFFIDGGPQATDDFMTEQATQTQSERESLDD